MAHYLRGDALARQSQWPASIDAFSRAVQLDRGFALALVGRAAARVSSGGGWAQAREDLLSAVEVSPQLAEAHSGLGWVLLEGQQPAETAARYFAQSLVLSKDYTIAAAGIGFAGIAGGDRGTGAQQVVEQMKKNACLAPLLAGNALLAAGWIKESEGNTPRSRRTPGTSVQRTETTITKAGTDKIFDGIARGDVGSFKQGMSLMRDNPALEPRMNDSLEKLRQTDPVKLDTLHDVAKNQYDWNQHGGWAEKLVDSSKAALSATSTGLGGAAALVKDIRAQVGLIAGAALLGGANEALGAQSKITERNMDVAKTAMDQMEKMRSQATTGSAVTGGSSMGAFKQPGGATTNLSAVRFDTGGWTQKAVFGLVYPTH